jgi:hypothetical protein
MSSPLPLSPLHAALANLIRVLFEDRCNSCDCEGHTTLSDAGLVTLTYDISDAPRDWFFDTNDFVREFNEDIDTLVETEGVEYAAWRELSKFNLQEVRTPITRTMCQ